MTHRTVRALVDPAYRRAITTALLRRWAQHTSEYLGLPADASLDIAVTDDEHVRALNRTYRGLDEDTDVLSFPFQDKAASAHYYGKTPIPAANTEDFAVPPREAGFLGEVVIAFPYAQGQALIAGHSVRDEIMLLLVHGILHLLGYDHTEKDQERRMWEKTQEILDLLAARERTQPS